MGEQESLAAGIDEPTLEVLTFGKCDCVDEDVDRAVRVLELANIASIAPSSETSHCSMNVAPIPSARGRTRFSKFGTA